MGIPQLNIDAAYDFYKKYILGNIEDKAAIFEKYGFSIESSVGSIEWEVFAAILLNDRAKSGDGADLVHHEVKSAITSSSFEYQYHKDAGLGKFAEDKQVDHVFISRSKNYLDIEVWWLDRKYMKSKIDGWIPGYLPNYEVEKKQRYRKSVSYNYVVKNALLIMKIVNGHLDRTFSKSE